MEFFRWILILTGIAMLVAAFMMSRKKTRKNVGRRVTSVSHDPSLDDLESPLPTPPEDPLYADESQSGVSGRLHSSDSRSAGHSVTRADLMHVSDEEIEAYLAKENRSTPDGFSIPTNVDAGPDQARIDINNEFDAIEDFDAIDRALDAELDNRASNSMNDEAGVISFASAVRAAGAVGATSAVGGTSANESVGMEDDFDRQFAEEFSGYAEPVQLQEFEEKLVAVNVVASRGRRFYGNDLKALFDRHGYTYGRMSLYHCSLEGNKVFSVANMVKPGMFDPDQMRIFETPGITLFMRLPVELDADVAFNFLIQEAKELASELDGQLRDEARNPLTEQTIQHMREDIQQYVFRTRKVLQPVV